MANTYLTKTFSQTATSTKKGTFSCWFKRGTLGGEHDIIASPNGGDGGGNRSFIRIDDNNNIDFRINNSTNTNIPNMVFRDTNAWYHIVLAVDLTQSGGGDRLKFYVNGNLITSYSSQNYPSGSLNISWGQNNVVTNIGYDTTDGGAGYFDGAMSHIHWTDGYTYSASDFGETDVTTGEWKAKASPSVTYGTNGFFILKDGNSVTDQSGRSNNFTVGGGTLTNLKDNPDNVFATLNPLSSLSTFSNGNTEAQFSSGSGYQTTTTTLGMTSGKYYCEAKVTVDGNYPGFGICETNSPHASKLDTANWLGSSGGGIGWYVGTTSGNAIYYNDSGSTGPTSFSTNDIVGMALDLDSAQNTLKYYKNGTLVSTQNISTSSNGWMFGVTHNTNQTPARSKFNFGNGYFGTTAITTNSGNGYSGAEGSSKFNYTVPTGYSALSTKGLNE